MYRKNFSWIKYLNVKGKKYEKHVRECLYDPNVVRDFLIKKIHSHKENFKLDSIKIKNL